MIAIVITARIIIIVGRVSLKGLKPVIQWYSLSSQTIDVCIIYDQVFGLFPEKLYQSGLVGLVQLYWYTRRQYSVNH